MILQAIWLFTLLALAGPDEDVSRITSDLLAQSEIDAKRALLHQELGQAQAPETRRALSQLVTILEHLEDPEESRAFVEAFRDASSKAERDRLVVAALRGHSPSDALKPQRPDQVGQGSDQRGKSNPSTSPDQQRGPNQRPGSNPSLPPLRQETESARRDPRPQAQGLSQADLRAELARHAQLPDPGAAAVLSATVGFGAGHLYADQIDRALPHLAAQLVSAGIVGVSYGLSDGGADHLTLRWTGLTLLVGSRLVDTWMAPTSAQITAADAYR